MRDKNFNPYQYIPFIIIVFIFAKLIFDENILSWIMSSLKPVIFVLIIIYLLSPLVKLFQEKTNFNRTYCVILSYVSILLLLIFFILLIVPSITNSINSLIKTLPSSSKQFINYLNSLPFLNNFIDLKDLDNVIETIESIILNFSSNILKYSDTIISSVSSFISTFTLIILALLMAFYALKDTDNIGENIESFIVVFFPKYISTRIIRVAKLTDRALKKFLVGKLYTCIILGALISIGIVIFNIITPFRIPYAPLMGVIIGLTNIIPYVGPIIGTIPCLLLALFSGVWESVGLLTIVLIMQQIDNLIVSPKILGETVGLKPFWVILSVTVGGTLFGAIGMVLSVPIFSVVLHLIEEKMDTYYQSEKKNKKI